MKKLVLGIISVFLTQLVFVAYNWNGDELAADVGRVSELKIETEQWPVMRNVRPPYPETISAVTESISESPRAATVGAKVENHKPVARSPRLNTFDRGDVVFEPKVITYSTVPASFTERPQIVAAKVQPAATIEPQPVKKKKRSLIQKTGSVIKKPFVWIKDLVAKMN